MREALRRLTRLEVQVHIQGLGVVIRQAPAPGTPLPLSRGCQLWCAPTPVVSVMLPGAGPIRSGVAGGDAAADVVRNVEP